MHAYFSQYCEISYLAKWGSFSPETKCQPDWIVIIYFTSNEQKFSIPFPGTDLQDNVLCKLPIQYCLKNVNNVTYFLLMRKENTVLFIMIFNFFFQFVAKNIMLKYEEKVIFLQSF